MILDSLKHVIDEKRKTLTKGRGRSKGRDQVMGSVLSQEQEQQDLRIAKTTTVGESKSATDRDETVVTATRIQSKQHIKNKSVKGPRPPTTRPEERIDDKIERLERVMLRTLAVGEPLELNRDIVDLLFACLSFKDIANLRVLNRNWLNFVRSYPIRFDRHFEPRELSFWKKRLARSREWNIIGIRIQDALPADGMKEFVVPENLEFLQLSCLCLPRKPMPFSFDLHGFSRLKTLQLDDMMQLRGLQELEHCSKTLEALSLKRCMYLEDTTILGSLERLESIEIRDCRGVKDLQHISHCKRLRKVTISGLDQLENTFIAALVQCPNVTHLHLSRCVNLNSLQGIERLPLEQLVLRQLPELVSLPAALSQCMNLHTVVASSCQLLADFAALENCKALVNLDVSSTNVSNLNFLMTCPKLERLDLSVCTKLQRIDVIAFCRNLRALSLWKCRSIKFLAPLSVCPSLVWVDITGVHANPPAQQGLNQHRLVIVSDPDGSSIFAHRERLVDVP